MQETLHVADLETSIGALRLASSESGLCYVALPHASGRGFAGWIARYAAGAAVRDGFAPNRDAAEQLIEYLDGKRTDFDLPLDLRSTDFQRAVYARIGAVPYGESLAYGELARSLGKPGAVRAVGAATGANPVPLVVACHRILGAGGQLSGYVGGTDLQARLLAMERDHTQGGQGGRLI